MGVFVWNALGSCGISCGQERKIAANQVKNIAHNSIIGLNIMPKIQRKRIPPTQYMVDLYCVGGIF
jgi:hypothetical protein